MAHLKQGGMVSGNPDFTTFNVNFQGSNMPWERENHLQSALGGICYIVPSRVHDLNIHLFTSVYTLHCVHLEVLVA